MFGRDRDYHRGYRGYGRRRRRGGILRWIAEIAIISGVVRIIRRAMRGY
ncbi:MAG TPA: hypothetical protein VKT25_10750 [Ktedonobacteraceae bacterium]|nr:hypothetical protein [Ktedonobacteraceae bacterium]